MGNENSNGVHWSFWAIGIFALLWNALGFANYVMQVTADSLVDFPETHRAIIQSRPAWATGGFALGVSIGAIGGLMLLFRKSTATIMFAISLLGVLVTSAHTLSVARSVIKFSVPEFVVMIVMPVVVAIFLLGYAKLAAGKGWLK